MAFRLCSVFHCSFVLLLLHVFVSSGRAARHRFRSVVPGRKALPISEVSSQFSVPNKVALAEPPATPEDRRRLLLALMSDAQWDPLTVAAPRQRPPKTFASFWRGDTVASNQAHSIDGQSALRGVTGLKAASFTELSRLHASQPSSSTSPDDEDKEMLLDEFMTMVGKSFGPQRDSLEIDVGARFAHYMGLDYATKEQKRIVWHHIANLLYQTLTQIKGIPKGCTSPEQSMFKTEIDKILDQKDNLKRQMAMR